MMRLLTGLALSLPLLLSLPALADEATSDRTSTAQIIEGSRISTNLVIKVHQREAAADALVEKTQALGGYFSERTMDYVTLRVPVDAADGLLAFADEQGLVVQRQYSREDISAQLTDQQARLDTRKTMLSQYYALMPEASAESVLTVERQIAGLVSEIELLEGQLKLARHQAAFATVEVRFQFRDRAAPTRDGSSSFEWLNTLNLVDVVEDFQYERRGEGPRAHQSPATPEGFSAFRRGREYRAVSPDGVLYRVRAAKHDPEADLDFWTEAVKVRMTEAGYSVVREETVTAGGATGSVLELAAPFGQTDYSYLIAVFPSGKKIILAEAAGEVARFDARRDAVQAAILSLTP